MQENEGGGLIIKKYSDGRSHMLIERDKLAEESKIPPLDPDQDYCVTIPPDKQPPKHTLLAEQLLQRFAKVKHYLDKKYKI
jgi:hypothetical protein